MLESALSGKTLFVTGATGFLGTALVETVLRALPETNLVLLIRPGRNVTAEARADKDLFRNNCFDRLRDQLGAENFKALIARRVRICPGDVGTDGLGLDAEGQRLLSDADVVIHSAATVSFDAMFDQAVEINLLGPTRVMRAYQAARENHLNASHFVSVSTAYVAGSRKGDAPELSLSVQPHYPEIPWLQEVNAARAQRTSTEASSREPSTLAELRSLATAELGAAGVALLSEKVERLRADWVKDQMVAKGRARAQSLGWPDAYAMTKALGERLLESERGDIPLSIVRPSIIESALRDPYPGWIRGFRMAEPIIISFARGLLKDFPGVPEGIVDVIPVDLVVGAILAAAAHPPETIKYYHAASGSQNPLKYRQLVSLIRRYFSDNPLYDDIGQAIAIPEWTYPARGQVESTLRRSKRIVDTSVKLISKLPLRSNFTEYQDQLAETQQGLERAGSYVELYGAYAECEAIYLADNLMELAGALDDRDRETISIDPHLINWESFVLETHLPSVVEHARARTRPKSSAPKRTSREDRLRASLLTGHRLAAFDLENTILAANVVDSFSWLATASVDGGHKLAIAASLLAEAPQLLALDSRDRSDFLRYFYRRYRGAELAELERRAPEFLTGYLLRKSFPLGLARVRAHRQAGHYTVCITGALSFAVAPLSPLFDEMLALNMTADTNGRLTGEVPGALPIGEARGDLLRKLAQTHGYEFAETIAYADSTSDLPMLEAAGTAVAVNPDTKLRQLARRRGWLIEEWSRARGYGNIFLPIGRTL
ncbi:MAG: HAD-IB family phosphatase [Ferrimicrobium sp.]|uniref:HAD-IB family phosphatase n=1 Tax=Ferrimicrobium acidiphilum TaxID=121039 RepID=A0ABV3Y1L5_9ACTN|nr:HAD-IB family phosphatase [Ferrimicrobium sp.]